MSTATATAPRAPERAPTQGAVAVSCLPQARPRGGPVPRWCFAEVRPALRRRPVFNRLRAAGLLILCLTHQHAAVAAAAEHWGPHVTWGWFDDPDAEGYPMLLDPTGRPYPPPRRLIQEAA